MALSRRHSLRHGSGALGHVTTRHTPINVRPVPLLTARKGGTRVILGGYQRCRGQSRPRAFGNALDIASVDFGELFCFPLELFVGSLDCVSLASTRVLGNYLGFAGDPGRPEVGTWTFANGSWFPWTCWWIFPKVTLALARSCQEHEIESVSSHACSCQDHAGC